MYSIFYPEDGSSGRHQTYGTYIANYTASQAEKITIVMVPYTPIVAEQANTLTTQ